MDRMKMLQNSLASRVRRFVRIVADFDLFATSDRLEYNQRAWNSGRRWELVQLLMSMATVKVGSICEVYENGCGH